MNTPWSETTKSRRLSWFGHLLRLPEETPARQALKEFPTKVKRPVGKPKTTWLSVVKTDLENADIHIINTSLDFSHVTNQANNRVAWKDLCRRVMSAKDGKRD